MADAGRNMLLEDMLDLLAVHGRVTVERVDYSNAASPHIRGRPKAWRVRALIEGTTLDRSWITAYVEGEAERPTVAANAALDKLEEYLNGNQIAGDRQRYQEKVGRKA